jgi:hypothetical protein
VPDILFTARAGYYTMSIRAIGGTLILLAVLIILPVSAVLPDVGTFSHDARTGTAWVTVTSINGTGDPQNLVIGYMTGDVMEIPSRAVAENPENRIVIVRILNGTSDQYFTLSPANSSGSAYAINSVTVSEGSTPLYTNNLAFTNAPATANYYSDIVPDGKQHKWVDLDWKDTKKDLHLTIFAPDATFGPYDDASDGKTNGRIFLDIASMMNVTSGHWFFRVQNEYPDPANYSLNTYSA